MSSQDYKYANQFILWLRTKRSLEDEIAFDKFKKVFSNRCVKSFDKIEDLMKFIKNILFKDTYLIITDTVFKDFISIFYQQMKDIYVIPKFIIYSKNSSYLNTKIDNKYHDYFEFGERQTSFIKIAYFIKNLEEKNEHINLKYPKDSQSFKKNFQLTDKFGFESIDTADKLVLPIFFRSLIKIDSQIKVNEFTHYLYDKYRDDGKIENLLAQIINIKNIPIELLCKYWARVYTADSFCYDLNESLKNNNYNKYKIFIQMMYEGLNLQSLKCPNNNIILYRGTFLTNSEFNEFKENLKKSNYNNLPSSIVYSKGFLSFSKNIEIAKDFALRNTLGINMKRILFILEGSKNINYNTNADLEKIAFFEKEQEILFFPFSCFEIINITNKVYRNAEFKEIKINYVSHYDSKLKNIFINENSERSFISSSIDGSNFKDDIIKSSLIEKENLDNSLIIDIIQKSSNYDEEEFKKETNEKNTNKIQN